MIKKIIFFQFFILALWACKQNKEYTTEKEIIVSGRVLNHSAQKEEIELNIFRICQEREIITSEIDSSGNFKFRFYSSIPLETLLMYNLGTTVLSFPGDSIYIEFNGNQNNPVKFLNETKYDGSSSKLNSDINAFKIMLNSSFVQLNKVDLQTATMQFDIQDFELYLDTMQQANDSFLEEYNKKISPCNDAKEWCNFYLKQNIYEAIVNYAFIHPFKDQSNPPYFNIPVSFYDRFLELSPINYSTFLNSKDLPRFIDKYWHFYAFFNFVAEESFNQNLSEQGYIGHAKLNDSIEFLGLIKYTPDELLRQLLFTEKIKRDLEALRVESYETNKEMLSQMITEPFLKNVITKKYTLTKEKLDNPRIASDAILNRLMDSSAKEIMDSILIGNQDKVIYIDCWADYCGPCLAEMPNSKNLMEKLKGKNVSFIYVCLNSKEKQWKALLDRFQLSGQHYFLNETQSAEWEKVFNITGVPYYFLINKNGTIIENGSYLRPEVAGEKIEKLLNE